MHTTAYIVEIDPGDQGLKACTYVNQLAGTISLQLYLEVRRCIKVNIS